MNTTALKFGIGLALGFFLSGENSAAEEPPITAFQVCNSFSSDFYGRDCVELANGFNFPSPEALRACLVFASPARKIYCLDAIKESTFSPGAVGACMRLSQGLFPSSDERLNCLRSVAICGSTWISSHWIQSVNREYGYTQSAATASLRSRANERCRDAGYTDVVLPAGWESNNCGHYARGWDCDVWHWCRKAVRTNRQTIEYSGTNYE